MSVYKRQLVGGFWQVNQTLARHFKCKDTALVLDELIFHEAKHADADGWFFYNSGDLEEKCLIGEKLRKSCFRRLEESKVLEIQRRGNPYRFYFRINGEILDRLVLSTKVDTIDCPEEGNIDRPEEGNLFIYKEGIYKKDNNISLAQSPVGDVSDSDFLECYKKYPRKEGKTRGLKTCRSQIKTKADLEKLTKAIENYATHCRSVIREERFIKHFSSFMSEWRDWIELENSEPREMNEEEIKAFYGIE